MYCIILLVVICTKYIHSANRGDLTGSQYLLSKEWHNHLMMNKSVKDFYPI